MKLFIETNKGEKIEIKEIQNVNTDSDILIFFIKTVVGEYAYLKAFEEVLSHKTGKKCVVLDGSFSEKVYGV